MAYWDDEEKRWRDDEEYRFARQMDRDRYGREGDYYSSRGSDYEGGQWRDRDYDRGAWRDRGSWRGRGDWSENSFRRSGDYGSRFRDEERDWEYNRDWRSREPYRVTNPYDYRDRGRSAGRNWGGQEGESNRGASYGRRAYWDTGDNDDVDYDYDEEPITVTYTEWWLVPGPFTGMGPRDYQRSDERIMEEVCDRLTQHGQVDASEVEIQVNNGEVTLNGSVPDRRTKRMVEDVAESVFGVSDVHNRLKVNDQRRMSTRSGGDWSQRGDQGMNRQIRQGMQVFGSDGQQVGTVKEARGNEFLLDRDMARDLWVPLDACQMSGGRITLNVRSDQVDNQGWRESELVNSANS